MRLADIAAAMAVEDDSGSEALAPQMQPYRLYPKYRLILPPLRWAGFGFAYHLAAILAAAEVRIHLRQAGDFPSLERVVAAA